MTSITTEARDRMTITGAMAVIAMAAIMLTTVKNYNIYIKYPVIITVELILPWYYLGNLGRSKSAAELAVAALAMAYLSWGALLQFWPGIYPRPWYVWSLINDLYISLAYRIGRRPPRFNDIRGNWRLLAAFYAAILLTETARRLGKRPARAGLGGPTPPPLLPIPIGVAIRGISAVAAMALGPCFFLKWFPRFLYFGPAGCGWLGLCPIGLAGSLVLAVADWRPRPPFWRPARFAVRLAAVIPAGAAGVAVGLVWSLWGWRHSLGSAACFLVIIAVYSRIAPRRRRRVILILLLAMFWGFALSAGIVKEPLRSSSL